jgi:hypothetical protein
MGRRDAMCREYQATPSEGTTELKGNRPDCSLLPWLLRGPAQTIRFSFDVSHSKSTRKARLRIHTADQHNAEGPLIEASVNGKQFEQQLKPGLGIQFSDPGHLAFPATAQFTLPAGTLRPGANVLAVRVSNNAWFTWDAMDLLALPEGTAQQG